MIKPAEKAMIAEAFAEVFGPLEAQVARLEKAAAYKKRADDLARQVIDLYDRTVEQEIAAGVRKSRPVRKAGMTITQRLQEIVDEMAVAKRAGPPTFRGMM
jgi:serine protease inhibitor ecotin